MPTFILDEPLPALLAPLRAALSGCACEVADWRVVDSAPYLHDEAQLLDEEELADAARALREDGILEHASDESTLRAAVKYGWAIAHLESVAGSEPVEWTVADGTVATTPEEHAFLCAELGRRGLRVRGLAPCAPGRLEPAIDYAGEVDRFAAWRASLPPTPLVFANASDKFAILPFLRGDTLRVDRLAWMAALRLVARRAAPLFRELLAGAQEHFTFDKGRAVFATSEEEIRGLPLVADEQLEGTFLDDPRGRQLLHVTAGSLVAAPERRAQLDRLLASESGALAALIAAEARRHLAAVA